MAIDDLIKVNDAEIRAAQAQADIANTMADVATKVARLGEIREDIIKKRLENVAKALDIRWDQQAHDHLLRSRNQALQKARRHQNERNTAQGHFDHLGRLLAGDGMGITAAWIAFKYFQERSPASALLKMGRINIDPVAYTARSWRHPDERQFGDVPEDDRDLGQLWKWARTNNLYPRTQSAAWNALGDSLEIMGESAKQRVDELVKETKELEDDARELAKIDWDRLNENP